MHALIVLSHLRWDFVYQRPQHLLSRLARTQPIIFVEEPVRNGTATAHLERFTPCPNVEVLRPHTPSSAVGFDDDQLQYIEPLLADYLNDYDLKQYDLWFYTPMALPLMKQLKPRLVVYDCMDELAAFAFAPQQLINRERELLKRADVVLTGGPSLYDAKRGLHSNVICLPSAVDEAHFSKKLFSEPDPQQHIAKPRLGFYGVIDERLDCNLVAAVADANPNWQVVMVGPVVKISPADLPQRPNIHWVGQESYGRLPHWVSGWDACLMPFALNEATRFISPTKTLEYMAAGKPVVSTAITDVERLYGESVSIAHSTAEFVMACHAALAETEQQRQERILQMRSTVKACSWDNAAARVRHVLAQAAAVKENQQSQKHQIAAAVASAAV